MIHLTLNTGEPARIVLLDGDKTTLESPRSSPPGSTVTSLVFDDANQLGDFQIKVNRCRKVGEVFHIDGRIRNGTREVRAALTQLPTGENAAAPSAEWPSSD